MTTSILSVENVSVSFDGFRVLNQLNFAMNYGELRFLIGPNGAGKTTLLDIITGKTRPNQGKIVFDDTHQINSWTEHRRVQMGISRKFQTAAIFGSLSVYQNLEVACSFKTPMFGLISPLNAFQRDKVDDVLNIIGLKERVHILAGTLSHGEKQWLEIGMMLTQDPKLLLLDEPVAGMTRRERDKTGELLQKIVENHSVLVVEHDMVFVRQFASRVTVLHMGQLLYEGNVVEVQDNPKVIEVYLGRNHDKNQ